MGNLNVFEPEIIKNDLFLNTAVDGDGIIWLMSICLMVGVSMK